MSLPPRQALSNWSAEIGRVAEGFMNAEAKFYDSAKVLKITCKARVQQIKSPQDASTATQYGTKRAIRLQIPLTASTGIVEKGWLVQLTGTNDPTLTKVTLSVVSAVNSSHAALRTVECASEIKETPRA